MKNILTRITMSVTLLAAVAAQAQTPQFQVGDSVEAKLGNVWYPGVVTKGMVAGTYVVNSGTMVIYANQGPDGIRAHTMTPAEKAVADQSARALATRPTGNGIGSQYGAREPTTCANRKAPPTAGNVRQYVLCDMEGVLAGDLYLLTNVTVQLAAPRRFLYQQDSGSSQVDVRAPVIDIRGSFKQYQCSKPIVGAGAYTATHNCNLYDQPVAAGNCFRNTFGDWHCSMAGNRLASTNQVKEQMPPRGY